MFWYRNFTKSSDVIWNLDITTESLGVGEFWGDFNIASGDLGTIDLVVVNSFSKSVGDKDSSIISSSIWWSITGFRKYTLVLNWVVYSIVQECD